MSNPNIPNITPTISLSVGQTVPLLLGSIALEELALAHLLNAEAEKLQFVLGTLTPARTTFSPATVSLTNLFTLDTSVQRTLRDVIKKEMLLEFKFENVLDLVAATATCTTRTTTFSNTTPILIPAEGTEGPAAPYPSPIVVSGLTGSIIQVTVTFNNLSHTFPADISAMLVGPAGNTGPNTILMSSAGGGTDINNVTLTFDDNAATTVPTPIVSGTYRPTNNGIFGTYPPPAPAPSGNTLLSVFNGMDPNGVWNLYIIDQALADSGIMAGGWELHITTCETGDAGLLGLARPASFEDTVQQLLQKFHATQPTEEDKNGKAAKMEILLQQMKEQNE
ncbi:hypothetical protein ACFPA1_11730 [Neobacillus sp. GCM10023253]|uniref:hypothetical protein n=1 Tax=Neobacillus sp. GCM10023253 TaxID=3252644 RepID=UPI00361BF662